MELSADSSLYPPDKDTAPNAETAGKAEYQPGKTSWSADRADIDSLLTRARQVDLRSIYYGSNACYLVVLEHHEGGRSLAVYKPARGEYPLWDFPQGSLYRREVATYRLDRLLGWGIVPPTVIGSGRFGPGSVQLFVEESEHGEVPVAALRHMILLDWIANNADRKPDHLLVSNEGRLWGIDHGLTFHAQPKLRTVLWHFAGESLMEEELADLHRVEAQLSTPRGRAVNDLLEPEEAAALVRRIGALARGKVFPDPQRKAMPYRW